MNSLVPKGGVLLSLIAAGLWAQPVQAEQLALWELSPGAAQSDSAQYVAIALQEVQSLDRYSLHVELADGTRGPRFAALSGAPPDATGFLLVGTGAASELYGVTPDVLVSAATLPVGSGRLCLYEDDAQLDCVAYGQFTGDNGVFGSPVPGVQLGQALTRIALTGNNFTDWAVSFPSPARFLVGGQDPFQDAPGQPPGPGPGPGTDGGSAFDGGVIILPPGFQPDSGVIILPPGFQQDAGMGFEPGVVDGGTRLDGGTDLDGGAGFDGGADLDGGVADGGRRSILAPEISFAPEDGEIPDQSVGCACSSGSGAGPLAFLALLLIGLGLVRRRLS